MRLWAASLSSDPAYRQTLEQIEREFGAETTPQLFKRLEAQPALLIHLWGQFRTLVLFGDLPRMLKELVGLVVAAATHCDHIRILLLHSLVRQHAEEQTLSAIMQGNYESAAVSHATLAVLRFTAMATDHQSASGAIAKRKWQSLYQQTALALNDTGLEEDEQLELIATIALFEQLCIVANLLQLDASPLHPNSM